MKVQRAAEAAIFRLAAQFPVLAIIGPRQSGKSTLARMAFPQKQYLTFDDKALRSLAAANPQDFLLAFPDGAIIDEAQKVPEIFDAVKYHVDSQDFQPGKYILTGSSQLRLRENISDSMAGRVAFIRLLPFSLAELDSHGLLAQNPYEAILKGAYPPLHDPDKRFVPEDWFQGYIDTYLDLDVRENINPSNLQTFRKFIQLCAVYSGQQFSMDSMARHLGISAPTVKQWLSVLESSFIIHFLQPDALNLGRSLVKSPKLYFVDTGLLCHLLRLESLQELILSQQRGAVVETFAVAELRKGRLNLGKKDNLTYFRDLKGFEVDVIADWKRSFAIEVKSTSDAEEKLSAAPRKYLGLRQDENCSGAVFYLGDHNLTINGMEYVGWRSWGTFSQQN